MPRPSRRRALATHRAPERCPLRAGLFGGGPRSLRIIRRYQRLDSAGATWPGGAHLRHVSHSTRATSVRSQYMSCTATARVYAGAHTPWGWTLVGGTSPPASKLSTVRSATHSSAPPLASCAGASISSGGCGRGGVAPLVAAPCTNGRTDGSAQDSASSTDSFARRPSCPRLRRLFRRVRREAHGTTVPRRLTRRK